MARLGVLVAGSVVLAAVLASVGCGSSQDSTFGDGTGAGGGGDNQLNGSLGTSGGPGGSSGSSGQVGAVGGVSPDSACATSSAGVASPPISGVK